MPLSQGFQNILVPLFMAPSSLRKLEKNMALFQTYVKKKKIISSDAELHQVR
jgi:hypothetical protein